MPSFGDSSCTWRVARRPRAAPGAARAAWPASTRCRTTESCPADRADNVRGNRPLPTWANALPSASSKFGNLAPAFSSAALRIGGRFVHRDADHRHALAKRLDDIRPEVGQLLARHPPVALPEHDDRRLLAEQVGQLRSSLAAHLRQLDRRHRVAHFHFAQRFVRLSKAAPAASSAGAGIGPVKRRALLSAGIRLVRRFRRRFTSASSFAGTSCDPLGRALVLQPSTPLGRCRRPPPLCGLASVAATGRCSIASPHSRQPHNATVNQAPFRFMA